MNCEYKYHCKFHSNDDVCNEFAENCRVHNRYAAEHLKKVEAEREQARQHELTDVGLVDVVSKIPPKPTPQPKTKPKGFEYIL